jgi:carotenoid cleavage dioxygenase-like enzyme
MSERSFHLGFTNLDGENEALPLQTEGHIPAWLTGTLFRNGPAKFSTDSGWHSHWFDGLAMIHKFSLYDSRVSYSNRFLRTRAYDLAMTTGEMSSGFGTAAGKRVEDSNNANVSIGTIDGRFVAMTESPGVIEFDPASLETKGLFDFGDAFAGQLTTAHPHYDLATGRIVNFTDQFGLACTYNLYSIAAKSRKRELIASVPTAYRYAYGSSTSRSEPEKYANKLAKVDTVGGQTKIWHEPACYPGKPIFVERPNATREDDGVVVSVVLDGRQGRSFLAVLDAGSFEELGWAIGPHHIPFGFHGMFTEERWT